MRRSQNRLKKPKCTLLRREGAIGDFSDATPTTKAGVVEDNEDFRDIGELFYWHSGDEALLLFIDNENPGSDTIQLTYTAVIDDEEKLKERDFTTTGDVPEGNYTVYGLYPAEADRTRRRVGQH